MNGRWVIPIVVAITLIGIFLITVLSRRPSQQVIIPTPTPTTTPLPTSNITIAITINPTPTPTPQRTTTPTPTPRISDLINVTSPSPNQLITSPLTISGRARGTWFFEADAPVQLLDGNNQEIIQGTIIAQGDWQTANFVPFTGRLNFSTPTTNTGQLILKNNNPSGLPQNSRQIIIPIRFR